ncbi:hypothetical protein SDC9_200965 [bioreactor metagenome]|uniref:Uncharacterized protein n=1 Tax=bioreactor metagenome TaxID=1076179 RepID=A0A645IPP6_9ZZZZ
MGRHVIRPHAAHIQLPVGKYPVVTIHGMPEHSAWVVIPPVHGAEAPPPAGDREGRRYMARPGKFPEKLAGKHIPIPIQIGAPKVLRQGLQKAHIVWIRREKHGIIPYPCRNKDIIFRPLSVLIPSVDKQSLYPPVPRPAGIAGIIHPGPQAGIGRAVAGG